MDKLKDSDLREAIRRKYVNIPQVPIDFEEIIMKRIQKDWNELADTISLIRKIPLAGEGKGMAYGDGMIKEFA